MAEVRTALFSIPDDKSPGPDGYTSAFFKAAWHVVGGDVVEAVRQFFRNGQLLKQINATTITLIPKKENPLSVMDFRPIACCNVIYKILSKVICGRLAEVLPQVLCDNQSAFTRGRSIMDNILICQDLVRLYHRKTCSPRFLVKVDLKKAYDSVEWVFVEQILTTLQFPKHFVMMIMQCISSPTYSLSLNGNTFGYFTLCMDYLSRVLRLVGNMDDFKFHSLCKALKLNHLCFADDLVMFCKGDMGSIRWLMWGFGEFSKCSGLEMNVTKSEYYVNGVSDGLNQRIGQEFGLAQGKMPFRYLGVPISPKRLSVLDCHVVVEKIVARVKSLGARRLSYMGRLTLVSAVFNSLHQFWAQVFILPVAVIKAVDRVCRNFLWEGQEHYSRGCPVAWEEVCKEKRAGGLGIRDNRRWNVAAVGKLVWWIYSKSDHLWVKWVHHVYLKGKNWDEYTPTANSSWSWRKVCAVKSRMAAGFRGNGWTDQSTGYTIKEGYDWLGDENAKLNWTKIVWSRYNIPKHSFISWLGMKDRLYTFERMRKFGCLRDTTCLLCQDEEETSKHLFFECSYSRRYVSLVQRDFGLTIGGIDVWRQHVYNRRLSSLQRQFHFALFCGVLYSVWHARNVCYKLQMVLRPEISYKILRNSLVHRIKRLVKEPKCSDRRWLDSIV